MNKKILIVEDEFIVAKDLRILLERKSYTVCGIAKSVDEALALISIQVPDVVLLDIQLKGKLTGIDLAKQLLEQHIAFIYISSNSNQSILEAAKATQPDGFLVKPFRDKDVLVALEIAHYRHEHSMEAGLRRELQLQQVITRVMAESIRWEQKLLKIIQVLQPCLPFDYLAARMPQPDGISHSNISFLRIGFDEYQIIGIDELSVISGLENSRLEEMQLKAPVPEEADRYIGIDFHKHCQYQPMEKLFAHLFHIESNMDLPLILTSGETFCLSLYSRKPNAYTMEHLALYNRLKSLLILAMNTILAEKRKFLGESIPLFTPAPQEAVETIPIKGIVGKSHHLLSVLDQVTQVAPYETSVLILGESGTGKEKIAQAIHQLSPRKKMPMVVVNCAAIPANLIESELFGHEKGAFTGATNRRIGKFEMADEGTIFLDEIGEMPVELQVKLLRVLQDKKVERIGGKEPVKVNIRILAATNRNLEKEVAEGRFRLDLYYRLNVFPITLLPLRERKEDIKPLAYHFAQQICAKYNKPFLGIRDKMIAELEAWQWPGNIRELENCIEQAIILHKEPSVLDLKRPLGKSVLVQPVFSTYSLSYDSPRTLTDVKNIQHQTEKEYIVSVLKSTKGRIRGQDGAAEILNMKPTTLESRIAKLGIKKEDFQ